MCGIIGIFDYTQRGLSLGESAMRSMVENLRHRGPDDSGIYSEPGLFLGHTRLAVLDLSPAGHQPMVSPNEGRFVISFNGEIYNFREIRLELEQKRHTFHSQTDTEVLLLAWSVWGEKCLDRLEGHFAFAIYDRHERCLYLARDSFGVKPLFYANIQGQLYFSSEILALFGDWNPCPEPEPEDLNVYFTYNYLPAPFTGLKGVFQLNPGFLLKVDHNGIHSRQYWKPEFDPTPEPWNPKLIDSFEEKLSTSILSQTVSDAPLGIFLSGGLDSYTLASTLVNSGYSPSSFTLGFDHPKFDESSAAKRYAQFLKISNGTHIFKWSEFEIYEILQAMQELLADSSCFPMYQLSGFARKQITVALGGDGSDELISGYETYLAGAITPWIHMFPKSVRTMGKAFTTFLPSDNARYGWRMLAQQLLMAGDEPRGRDHASFRLIMAPSFKKRLFRPEFFESTKEFDAVVKYADLMNDIPSSRSYLTARQYADMTHFMPSVLAKVDRMSMVHGLEVRTPFLDRELVQFCVNLPDNAKRYKWRGKRILRNMITKNSPPGLLNQSKAGFIPPAHKWFRDPGPMIHVFGDYLNKAKTCLGWMNWDEVEKVWQEHRSGKLEVGFMLFGILQFMNWSFHCRKKNPYL